MRAPAAAMAATAAGRVGRNSTAVPPERAASVTASLTLWAYPTVSAVSGSSHTAFHQPPVQYRHVEVGQLGGLVIDPAVRRPSRRIQVVHDRAYVRPSVSTGGEPDAAPQLGQSGLGAVHGRDAGDSLPAEGVAKGSPTSTR